VLFVRHAESQNNNIPELESAPCPRPTWGDLSATPKGISKPSPSEKQPILDLAAIYPAPAPAYSHRKTPIALPHRNRWCWPEEIVEIAFTNPIHMGMIEKTTSGGHGRWAAAYRRRPPR